jgi:hypothetical protein
VRTTTLTTLTICLLACLFWATPASASGYYNDGNRLLRECEGEDVLGCYGYLAGMNDAISLWRVVVEDESPRVCIPLQVTLAQLQKVVVKHLRANPENLHKPAAGLVTEAYFKAFPCQKGDQ